jgi:hypothetical protein
MKESISHPFGVRILDEFVESRVFFAASLHFIVKWWSYHTLVNEDGRDPRLRRQRRGSW